MTPDPRIAYVCSWGDGFTTYDPVAGVGHIASNPTHVVLLVGKDANQLPPTMGAVVPMPTIKTVAGTAVVNANTSVGLALTWPAPFADTNYTVTAELEATSAILADVTLDGIISKTVNGISLKVTNHNLVLQRTATVTAIGVHP